MASKCYSSESQVLQRFNAELVTAVAAADLLSLAVELYSKFVIPKDTRDTAAVQVYTHQHRANIIISAVERKVEDDPSFFRKFTTILLEVGDDTLTSLGRKLVIAGPALGKATKIKRPQGFKYQEQRTCSEVLQTHNSKLMTAILAADPLSLAVKLYSKNLINNDTRDIVTMQGVSTHQYKIFAIVSAVERKVEADPSLLYQFAVVLETEEVLALKRLGRTLKYQSQRCDSYPLKQQKDKPILDDGMTKRSTSRQLIPYKPKPSYHKSPARSKSPQRSARQPKPSYQKSPARSKSPQRSARQPKPSYQKSPARSNSQRQPHSIQHSHVLPYQQFLALHLYADKLRTFYAQSELPEYSNPACYKWTPSPSKEYIDLSIIDKRGMTTVQVDNYKKAAVYGNIDVITKKGSVTTVKLEEILQTKPGETLQCVLVEGAPGIGKSTLAWQVCNRWGKRELFQQYSTVLLLPLRDKRVQNATSVKNLFLSTDEALLEQIHKEVIHWDGSHTLIILEGLDELPRDLLHQPSIFTALLSGEALPQATILVTSRPSRYDIEYKWKRRISRHIEIIGFTEENVTKYAQSVLHERFLGFKEYVSIYPHIQSMLYVPLHCVIAVTVYLQCQESRTPPPRTLTGLYTCLTQTILTQYLNDHQQCINEDDTLETVFNLQMPRLVHNYFKELCKIAFKYLDNQQLIFPQMPKELHDLGFTDAVPEMLLYQQSPNYSYNFLHLSIQEFLAAYHISFMSSREQVWLLKNTLKMPQKSHLKNTCRFVAGITQFEGLNKAVVKESIGIFENALEQSGNLSNYSLELLYECQHVSILDTELTYSVRFNGLIIIYQSPHLFLALGYCIANSSCGWNVALSHCSNITQAEMFLQGLNESKACHASYSIKSFECCNCLSREFTYKLFSRRIPETFIASIESLDLNDIIFLPHYLSELIPRMDRLITFKVHAASLSELITALSKVPKLKNMTLYEMNSTGIDLLFQSLPICQQLETLTLPNLSADCIEVFSRATILLPSVDINRSKFTFQSMQSFVSLLQQNKSLTTISIRECGIDNHSAHCLAEALHHNTTLETLDMNRNPVGERGVSAIAKALHDNTALRKLDISRNRVGEVGALAIAEMLKHNNTLEELYMGDTNITSDGVVAIAEALHHNTALRKLDMSWNFIKAREVFAIAEMLMHNITIEELNLNDKPLSGGVALGNFAEQGAKALMESLAVNQHLKKLILSEQYRTAIVHHPAYHNHKEHVDLTTKSVKRSVSPYLGSYTLLSHYSMVY